MTVNGAGGGTGVGANDRRELMSEGRACCRGMTSVAAQASWGDGDGVGDRGCKDTVSGDDGEDMVGDAVSATGLRGDGAEERACCWAVGFANPM